MMVLSYNVDYYLGDGSESSEPNVTILTAMFFFLNFLAATQDIAVDGWALTMLQVVVQSSILCYFLTSSETQCWLCLHLQFRGADSRLFHGLRLLHGPRVLWPGHPALPRPTWPRGAIAHLTRPTPPCD